MSSNESFIDEVTEEVRRDRLYGYLRRYGWIGVLVVLLIVGGAAWYEYRQSRAQARAEAIGDALLTALQAETAEGRAEALATVVPEGPTATVPGLLAAAALQEAGEIDAAVAQLATLAETPEIPTLYRDLARFKAAVIAPDLAPEARIAALDGLAAPGNPFRLLALEQIALAQVSAGRQDEAVATLRSVVEDAGVSQGLRDRAQSLIIALGAELEPADTPAN